MFLPVVMTQQQRIQEILKSFECLSIATLAKLINQDELIVESVLFDLIQTNQIDAKIDDNFVVIKSFSNTEKNAMQLLEKMANNY